MDMHRFRTFFLCYNIIMDEKQELQENNAQTDLQNKLINDDIQQSTQKDTSSASTNNSNDKTIDRNLVYYIVICFVSLFLFLLLRMINNPSKYEWCDKNGWPEGTGNCFSLGIEHFAIDASSLILLSASIAFAIIAIITFFKKKLKHQTNS